MPRKRPNAPISRLSSVELKALLADIALSSGHVNFRYRLIGQMWQPNFFRVLKVTNSAVFLLNEVTSKVVCIADLNLIVQFELDGSLQNLEPNFHYDVVPVE